MKKYKVYIARQIPINAENYLILDINSKMTSKEVFDLYSSKKRDCGSFLYNGPWILRPPTQKIGVFEESRLPRDLSPFDVWGMCQNKIQDSDVIVGIVSEKSYGTFAEVGFACALDHTAVYIVPDKKVSNLKDLWFIFQMSLSTRQNWKDDHFKNIPIFHEYEISNINDYVRFINSIVPKFMEM